MGDQLVRLAPRPAAGVRVCRNSERETHRLSGPASAAAVVHPGLSREAAQGLADLMPILLCGEESAGFVFSEAATQLPPHLIAGLREELECIAEDERRHAQWLDALRATLPPPAQRGTARKAVHFLRSLATPDLALHMTRTAALDAGVCVILAAGCRKGTPVAQAHDVVALFQSIRRDEGRHVRISRRCAAALGITAAVEQREVRFVLDGFATLLRTQAAAFHALQIDLPALLRRFNILGDRTDRVASALPVSSLLTA